MPGLVTVARLSNVFTFLFHEMKSSTTLDEAMAYAGQIIESSKYVIKW